MHSLGRCDRGQHDTFRLVARHKLPQAVGRCVSGAGVHDARYLLEAHQVAIQRMIAAGANMMTWMALGAEWQRDWARTAHAGQLTEILKQHAAGSGIAYLWEQQLLNTPVPANAG